MPLISEHWTHSLSRQNPNLALATAPLKILFTAKAIRGARVCESCKGKPILDVRSEFRCCLKSMLYLETALQNSPKKNSSEDVTHHASCIMERGQLQLKASQFNRHYCNSRLRPKKVSRSEIWEGSEEGSLAFDYPWALVFVKLTPMDDNLSLPIPSAHMVLRTNCCSVLCVLVFYSWTAPSIPFPHNITRFS